MTPPKLSHVFLAAAASLFLSSAGLAQNPHPATDLQAPSAAAAGQLPAASAAQKDAPAAALPADSVSRHTAEIAGESVAYTATAGSLPLHNAKGEVSAKLFYVSYVRN